MLEIRHVHASYGTVKLPDGINLTITGGSTGAIAGESGSGKSTLAGHRGAAAAHVWRKPL